MKLYLFLAIVVCKSCRADYDSSLLESTDPRSELLRYAPFMAGELAMWPSLTAGDVPGDGAGSSSAEVMSEFEWSPYQPRAPWSMMVKRSGAKADIQTRRRSALDKNFMRFGRAGGGGGGVTDLSKEYATSTEQLDGSDAEQQQQPTVKRNAAGNTEEVLGGGGVMMSDSGEQLKPKQVVYYRRDSPKNLMRFGKRRSTGSGYLRFGRAGNLMRFGRSDEPAGTYGRTARANLMRFGRAGNLMRFGRSERPQSSSNTTGMPPADSQPDARPKPSIRQSAATIPTNLIELFDALPSNTVAAGDEDDRLAMYVVEK
ncbi:hypothetical protein AND_001944 [Anopheles darlingi]|uniref:Uncharacterized protein n=1 Tax=Anopheles darlingi TaxID=43151 RepID=W5JTL7_ANODA|nr:hypothetical protein AND_001944 [Anopheles darlingi]